MRGMASELGLTCWNLNKRLWFAQSADTVPVSGQSGRSGMLLMVEVIITQNLMITEKENTDICKLLNLSEAKNTLKLQSGTAEDERINDPK